MWLCLFQSQLLFLSGVYLGMKLLGHMLTLLFEELTNCVLFLKKIRFNEEYFRQSKIHFLIVQFHELCPTHTVM